MVPLSSIFRASSIPKAIFLLVWALIQWGAVLGGFGALLAYIARDRNPDLEN